jgi:hypothetical protein
MGFDTCEREVIARGHFDKLSANGVRCRANGPDTTCTNT